MQELVKEVTVINHRNNGSFSLAGILSVLQYIIMLTKSIILELMNLLHRNKFSPWEDFFINPFGSDIISPNQLRKCTGNG